MTKILLHIGGEKTGTTSLQAAMSRNAGLLLTRHGVLYPTDGPLFADHAHFPFAAAFLERSECAFAGGQAHPSRDSLRQAIDSLMDRNPPKIIVFSAEHFSSRYRRPQLLELSRFFSPIPVEILFYARAQDELAVSAFGTDLQCGRKQWFNADSIGPDDPYFNHLLVADEWAAAFGTDRLRVRSYGSLAAAGLFADFLGQLDVGDPSDFVVVPRLNEAISLLEARILFLMNQHLPSWREAFAAGNEAGYLADQRLRQRLLNLLRSGVKPPDGRPLDAVLDATARARMIARFEDSNRQLERKYGAAVLAASRSAMGAEAPADSHAGELVLGQLLVALLRQEAAQQVAKGLPRRGPTKRGARSPTGGLKWLMKPANR